MKLGFGAWQLGGECTFGGRQTGWGKLDLPEAEKTIFEALEKGITFFDTAPGYGKGKSEEILGSVFSNVDSSKIQVCTKYGSWENSQGEAYLDFSKEALFRSVEQSLTRLKIDKLHTILLHSPADDFDFTTFDSSPFQELKSKDIISHYGVSVRSLSGAKNVLNAKFGDTIEAIFNVLDRRAEEQIFTHKNFSEYTFIARVPLASGFLSENFLLNPDLNFGSTDIRSAISSNDRQWYKEAVQKLAFLNELSGGMSVSALRYVVHHQDVNYVIPGVRSRTHLNKNLQALELGALPSDIQQRIKNSLPTTNPAWIKH